MTPESIFQVCSTIALGGWLVLIATPFWQDVDKFLVGVVVTLFAIIYAALIFSSFQFGDVQKFNSLDGVMELFRNPWMLTAGWVHYLAFDLMTGIWIRKNSARFGISHWLIIPCLLLTFMFGPVGLLLYLIVRLLATGRYFAENY